MEALKRRFSKTSAPTLAFSPASSLPGPHSIGLRFPASYCVENLPDRHGTIIGISIMTSGEKITNFRQLYNSYNFSTINYVSKNHLEWSQNLVERCIRVSNLGMASDERCEILVILMAKVERVMLATGTIGKNVQFKLVQCENRGRENSADIIISEGADKGLKRRGRPPKKRNDGSVDPMIMAKKRSDPIGTSYMESDMFFTAPTNLEAHVDSQENMILMAQFEQQASGNPTRSQWIYHQMLQLSAYCATKWAVEGLTRSIAKELPPGLAVIALSPGVVNTDMLTSCFGSSASLYQTPESWYHSIL